MDLELADEYAELRRATRSFVASAAPLRATRQSLTHEASARARQVDRALWRRGAAQGWTGMLAPAEHGGSGGDTDALCALAVVLDEVGRELVPGPLIPANVAVAAIARGGGAAAASFVPPIVAGDLVVTWALPELAPQPGRGVAVRRSGDGYVVDGSCLVPDAAGADAVLVTAPVTGDEGEVQLVVRLDAAGVGLETLGALDLLRPVALVRFAGVAVGPHAVVGPGDSVRDLDLAVTLLCAETVGALDRALEITLDYAKDRKAFGRPIGSFQALKHRLTDMNVWLQTGKALVLRAVLAIAEGEGAAAGEHASVAKAYLSEKGPAIVRDCLQIHGGIGFTWEHDIHLYLRRVETTAVLLGDAAWHHGRIFSTVGA